MKFKTFFKNHPYIFQVLLSIVIGIIGGIGWSIVKGNDNLISILSQGVVIGPIYGGIIVYPIILTLYQVVDFYGVIKENRCSKSILFDIWTIFLSISYELLYLVVVKEVLFGKDWSEVLRNEAVHTPIFTQSFPSICLIIVVFTLGIGILWSKNVNSIPPLLTVLSISATYLGVILRIVFSIQVVKFETPLDLALLLPPVVFVLIVAKTISMKIGEYREEDSRRSKIDSIPILSGLNRFLKSSKNWHIMAAVLMIPLLGIIICVLVLLGQEPDGLIKAFTETSQWNLSTKVSPPNVYYDEHYLCTVAAGGHRKIVKPIRTGVRHGNRIVVNRQLLIANAFEDLLQENLPRVHRVIRNFYDTYGFPIARLVKSRYIADIIWILMKPLEWFFLCVLYLFDTHPEDRICIQYTGK